MVSNISQGELDSKEEKVDDDGSLRLGDDKTGNICQTAERNDQQRRHIADCRDRIDETKVKA